MVHFDFAQIAEQVFVVAAVAVAVDDVVVVVVDVCCGIPQRAAATGRGCLQAARIIEFLFQVCQW